MKLSVCIPIYNPNHHFLQALESVLTQDFTDYELIIVDDCSTSPVDKLLNAFQDPRIQVHYNRQNLGIPGNWNRCLELAKGEYITIFHQDDLMMPGNLRLKVALLDAHNDVGFVHSDIMCIDEHNQEIGGHWAPQPDSDRVINGYELYAMASNFGNPIAAPAVMVRAESYRTVGWYDQSLPFATDLEMWLRLAARYKVGFIAQPVVMHRLHRSQEGARFRNTGRDFWDIKRTFDKTYARRLPPAYTAHVDNSYRWLSRNGLNLCKWQLKQGKIRNAFRYLSVSLACLLRPYPRTISK